MKTQRILPLIVTALLLIGITAGAQAQIKIADTDDTKLYITVGTFQALDQKTRPNRIIAPPSFSVRDMAARCMTDMHTAVCRHTHPVLNPSV